MIRMIHDQLLVFGVLLLSFGGVKSERNLSHIVIILADDLGKSDLRCVSHII